MSSRSKKFLRNWLSSKPTSPTTREVSSWRQYRTWPYHPEFARFEIEDGRLFVSRQRNGLSQQRLQLLEIGVGWDPLRMPVLPAAGVIQQQALGRQPQPLRLPAGAPVGQGAGNPHHAEAAAAGLARGQAYLRQFGRPGCSTPVSPVSDPGGSIGSPGRPGGSPGKWPPAKSARPGSPYLPAVSVDRAVQSPTSAPLSQSDHDRPG